MMDSDAIRHDSLQFRNQRPADDGRYQNSLPFSSQRAQPLNRQCENARGHHGVEQADQYDAPHRHGPETHHRRDDQQERKGHQQPLTTSKSLPRPLWLRR